MFPEAHLWNLIIPMYPLLVASGFLVGTVIAVMLGKMIDFSENYVFILMCWVEFGVIAGGKLLYLIVNIQKLNQYFETVGFIGLFTKTGFVFYGGFLGGILAVLLFSKLKKISFTQSLSLVITVTPLIHTFGRIGCFCAGCCYGKEWHGDFAVFIHGADRFPVQLLEASANLFLFILLFVLFYRLSKARTIVIPAYLFSYGLIRFITEMFRGDVSRGYVGFLSVSSWISILFVITGIIIFIMTFFQSKDIKNELN